MASFQERLAIIVEANAGRAIAEFRKVGTAAKEAGVGADAGAKGLGRFGIAGKTASNLLKAGIAVGVAGAATAIAKFAVDGVSAFEEVTGEVRKFQRVSGATAEDASRLVAAFHVLGIDADAAGTAVFRMAVKIGAGNKAFADTGVAIARTKTGAVDLVGTILNVGDAYKKLPDASQRADLLANVFGTRTGQTLIPLLGKTREEIEAIFKAAERHGLIFNQEQIDKGNEFRIATRELGEAFKGVEVAAGEQLIPFLTDLAIVITKVIDATHGEIGKGFKALFLLAAGPLGPAIIGAGKTLHYLAGSEGEAAREAAKAADAIVEEATKLDDLKKSIFTATDAQRSYEAAGRSKEAAEREQAKAQKEYQKLLKEGAVDEAKVTDARRSLADATRSLGHAQREQSKAQEAYNEAAAAAGILGTDTALKKKQDAADNLADANDSVASALEHQTNAAADLAKAKAGDPDYQEKLAAADQHVKDAVQGVADATYNLGKRSYENVAAHDAETKALSDKADQVERLRGDLQAMADLHPEQYAFLGPIIDALGGGNRSPVLPAPAGGAASNAAAGPWAPILGPFITNPETIPGAGAVTNNNVTINATTSEADARLIAREVIWNLN